MLPVLADRSNFDESTWLYIFLWHILKLSQEEIANMLKLNFKALCNFKIISLLEDYQNNS